MTISENQPAVAFQGTHYAPSREPITPSAKSPPGNISAMKLQHSPVASLLMFSNPLKMKIVFTALSRLKTQLQAAYIKILI